MTTLHLPNICFYMGSLRLQASSFWQTGLGGAGYGVKVQVFITKRNEEIRNIIAHGVHGWF